MAFQSFPKPRPAIFERHEKRTMLRSHEATEKAKVRHRDGPKCRWPRCEFAAMKPRLEVAHLDAKGMGGDKQRLRTRADRMIHLCHLHHQGPVSLHSGDLKIQPQTANGTDGPCDFYALDGMGRWALNASETRIGISEPRA